MAFRRRGKMMAEEQPMKYRNFTITGKIYGPNESVAKHNIFWALRNSEYDSEILIDSVDVTEAE